MNDELHEAITVAIIDQTWVTHARNSDLAVAGSGLAADAILALPEMQALLAKDAEIVRLRAAGDALAEAVAYAGDPCDADTLAAWQEARRG